MAYRDRQQFILNPGSGYQRIEKYPLEGHASRPVSSWLMTLTFVAGLAFIGVIAYAVVIPLLNNRYTSWNVENVKTISGVTPDAGNNVEATAGLGLGFTPFPLTNTFQYDNRGVVTLNGISSLDPTRDFTLAVAGPALGLVPGASSLTWTSPAMVGINGIPAVANDFTIAVTGPALALAPGVSSITLSTPAVVTINGNSAVANDFQIAAGTAIGVATVGNVATISTPAITTINGQPGVANAFTLSAGNGLSVATLLNDVTYSDALADATQLADTDALGPSIQYEVAIGFFVPVAENSGWRTGVAPGFPMPFIPGSVDDGQGNAGGTAWNVPAIGSYNVHVDCEVLPSAIAVNDLQIVSAAFTLAAQTEDPLALAILPAGAYSTLDISGGTNANAAPPTVPRRLSMASTFQAGCVGCLVQVGDALAIHMSMERTGVQPGPYTVNGYCQVQVTRIR